jgi:HK97 family phage prohead protease
MHVKNVPIGRVKAGPDDGLEEGQFIVYPSTFIKEPDSYGDIVAKGAFLEDIAAWKESGNVLPGLYGHRMDDPDYFVAGALDMGEDDHGWWVKGEFDLDSPKGPQVYRLVKGRRLNQLSFAYDTLDEKSVTLEDGRKANELQRLKVYEFSFVPIGANQDTSVVAVKALADAVAGEFKAGRVLAQKHIDSLRSAQEAIGVVITAAEAINDQEKASGTPQGNDEEPNGAKSKPPVEPSARTLADQAFFLDLEMNA